MMKNYLFDIVLRLFCFKLRETTAGGAGRVSKDFNSVTFFVLFGISLF